MALTVTSRGTGTHNTGATTLVPGGRSATLAVGSLGVLCLALDNAGSAGAVTCAPSSWTDAKGNVWTRRQSFLYDNGAASAFADGMTSYQVHAFATGETPPTKVIVPASVVSSATVIGAV